MHYVCFEQQWDSAEQGPKHEFWRTKCVCGWEGKWHEANEEAKEEGGEHLDEHCVGRIKSPLRFEVK